MAGDAEVQHMQARGDPVGRGMLGHARRTLTTGAAVFAFWLVLSASLAPADLLLGAGVSVLLGWWSARFLWAGQAPGISLRTLLAILCYLLGLGADIVRAAFHVARVVLDPRLPIAPVLIVCRTRLRREVSQVAFAHSVTLTPGTLTVDMEGGTFLVHCLSEGFAARLESGELERRIARVFEREGESA
jgi:multicomponent Na+:H+ antiporter subunit E